MFAWKQYSLLFSVRSAVKLKQVRIANDAAKLTASVRWELLNIADDHVLWRRLEHRLLALYFQLHDFVSENAHYMSTRLIPGNGDGSVLLR